MNIQQFKRNAISQPLIQHLYTADPAAHVFNGKLYIYVSHDVDSSIPIDDQGSQFAMEDYHVLSIAHRGTKAVDHGAALHLNDVPWASKQLWAPDAAKKNDQYYLFFPAKDKDDVFRIGVAISELPEGPFIAHPEPIKNSFSIDPAVFKDSDNSYYMYFGGIWGGQLQRWCTGQFKQEGQGPHAHLPALTEPALCPKVARLRDDLMEFAEPPRDLQLLDELGQPLLEGDKNRRFFEGSWMHKYNGKYYFSYSTGDTHFICYAIGDSPYGPFIYTGRILEPVIGWTTHHSICEFHGKWYLFYHDSSLSNGITHLRSIKITELNHDKNGRIQTIAPYSKKGFGLW